MRFSRLLTTGLLLQVSIFAARAQDDSAFDVAGMQALRGIVTRVSGSTVFVKLRSGTVYSIATGPNTHFVKSAEATPEDPAKPGDTVLAGGELDAKKHMLGAVFLAVVDAQELAQLDERRAQFGKTWIAGTITAKAGTTMTVKLPNGAVDHVEVNEDTSFRRRHQDIIYPDLQVGDGMTATGQTVHGNIFVAKVLTVVDAAMIREWARMQD